MFTSRSFNLRAPITDGTIFELLGSNPKGFGLWIENQDAAKTVVYWLEDSPDGVNFTRISFPNGGDSNQFTLLAGALHNIKVTSTSPHIRLKARGDAPVSLLVTQVANVLQPIALPALDSLYDLTTVQQLTGGGAHALDAIDVDSLNIGLGRTVVITVSATQSAQLRKLDGNPPTGPNDIPVFNHSSWRWVQVL